METKLNSDVSFFFLDVKSFLFSNVPVREANGKDNPSEFSRKTMKKHPTLAVSELHCQKKCSRYLQKTLKQ